MIAAPPVAWSGTYALPASSTPVAISVQLQGRTATVSLGPGHSGATQVTVELHGAHIRFAFPGTPANVVFEGSLAKSRIAGNVRQGALRGAFTLRRGLSRILPLLGVYRAPDGSAVAVNKADGFAPWLVEIPSGATHGIGPSLTVGDKLGETAGNGSIAVDASGIAWNGTHYARVGARQREIRVGADAATLTLPSGAGPFPAVAMVHGSGPQLRDEFQTFAAYCLLQGIAVLADDKRGVGQSSGTYPGERATDATIDVLARDAQVEARFLAGLPQVDPKRVGLLGDSQAGWIIALAASREPAVRWVVSIVGPTVSVGETDAWADLAGKGATAPSGSEESMLARVRAQGAGGFDPRPSLRTLSIPAFWIFGDDDRNVPTKLCVEALQQLRAGHDFSWVVLPMTHTPIELPTGLFASLPRSRGFVPGFFPALGDWLRGHGLSS
jgi:pimeloyl-ACP methyl ester carboxylesterase